MSCSSPLCFKNPFLMPNKVRKSGRARQPTAKVHARTGNSPRSKKSTKLREHKVHKRSPKRSHKKRKRDVLTDDSLCSVTSDDQSEDEGDGRISEYALTKPHLKAKHSRPIDTQSISSLGTAAHETDEFAVSEHDEEIVEVASRASSIATRQSEIDLDRGSRFDAEVVSETSCAICNVNVSIDHK